MAPVDRKKYAVDILERVLGGVHATSDDAPETSPFKVVRLGVRPWLGLGTAETPPAVRPAEPPAAEPRARCRLSGDQKSESR